jgi:hypothetical protein
MRENTWQVDGWASTVHKARHRTSCFMTWFLTELVDFSTRKDYGFIHFDTPAF